MKPYKNQDPIRLVLADVDGTLVTQQKVLTEKTKEAVGKLREAGIMFATTSGRPPAGMQMVIKDVNLTTVVAGFNGGVFVTPRLDPIVTRDLPKDAIKISLLRSWESIVRRQRLCYRLGRSHQIQNQMTRANDPMLDFT